MELLGDELGVGLEWLMRGYAVLSKLEKVERNPYKH